MSALESCNRTVCVAIVTYNRKELLKNLLNSLCKQSYKISGIVIVDNNSEDGTPELLMHEGIINNLCVGKILKSVWNEIQIFYYRNTENTGGAGGFAKAFSIIRELPYDCIWVMDDDVAPDIECLRQMMTYLDDTARACIPCRGDDRFHDRAVRKYDLRNPLYFHINECKRECINFEAINTPYVYVEDMAFEGPLIDKKLIDEIGIPNEAYFIFYDDTDYAHRLCSVTKIRYVASAKLKKMIIPSDSGTWKWKSYYNLRNSVYFDKKYGLNFMVRYGRPLFRTVDLILRAIGKCNFYRIKWIIRAYRDGLNERMGKTYEPSEIPQR